MTWRVSLTSLFEFSPSGGCPISLTAEIATLTEEDKGDRCVGGDKTD